MKGERVELGKGVLKMRWGNKYPDAEKDPGRFVNKADAETFRIVCLETLNHELHRSEVLPKVNIVSR